MFKQNFSFLVILPEMFLYRRQRGLLREQNDVYLHTVILFPNKIHSILNKILVTGSTGIIYKGHFQSVHRQLT